MGLIYTCEDERTITLPACLAVWINAHYPQLKGGVGSVTINCCDKLWVGFGPVKYKQGGFTSDENTIHITGCNDPLDPCDEVFVRYVLHELFHILQRRRHPKSFGMRYVWRLVRYAGAGRDSGHPDEKHAYAAEDDLFPKYKNDNPCDCRF